MSEERLSVTLTREFDAPIELVFSAWTDAAHVARWMKCGSDVNLICDEWQPAVGARFVTTMEKPGEWRVQTTGRFTEFEPPGLLVYVSDAHEGMGMPEMEVRVQFESLGFERTRLTLTHSGMPNEGMQGVIQAGWTSSLGALAQIVQGDK